MRLVNAQTLAIEQFHDAEVPPYAILSHRWEDEEVDFHQLQSPASRRMRGRSKIEAACSTAIDHQLRYVWVDTCCIDKQSSSELNEAISSMYTWYAKAEICFAYLSDISSCEQDIADSLWFTRGWTLQELIAPRAVVFYSRTWRLLGNKADLSRDLAAITGIDVDVLRGANPAICSIAQRMSWASGRTTTRPEDRAYSLIGLFDVSLPMVYGEGDKAFIRLQEEIIKHSDDQSIFAWKRGFPPDSRGHCGLLALSPSSFAKCHNIVRSPRGLAVSGRFSITNVGLSLEMMTIPWTMDTYLAVLDCTIEGKSAYKIGILLERLRSGSEIQQYARVQSGRTTVVSIPVSTLRDSPQRLSRQICVRQTPTDPFSNRWNGFWLRTLELPGIDLKSWLLRRFIPETSLVGVIQAIVF